MTLYRFYKEKIYFGLCLFSVLLGCKFQAAFLAPFIVIYYFYKNGSRFWAFSCPSRSFCPRNFGYIFGRSLVEPIQIYLTQSGTYKDMYKKRIQLFWCLVAKQERQTGNIFTPPLWF